MKPTNRNRKIKAVKEEATRLHSRIVRTTKGPYCQDGCGRLATDAAHIIGRVFSHTRTDVDNAIALAAECHRRYTNHPDEWLEFLDQLIGRDEYLRLKRKAEEGVNVRLDWFDELDRLKAIWERIDGPPAAVIRFPSEPRCTCEEPTNTEWWQRPPHDPECPLNDGGTAA